MGTRAEWGGVRKKVFQYFDEHPRSTISEACAGLGLPIHTAYTTAIRLLDAGRLRATGDAKPKRYEACLEKADEPVAAPRVQPDFSVLTRPSGSLPEHAGTLAVFKIGGQA